MWDRHLRIFTLFVFIRFVLNLMIGTYSTTYIYICLYTYTYILDIMGDRDDIMVFFYRVFHGNI